MSTIDRPKVETLPPLVAGQELDRATFHERYEAMPPETRAELIGGVVYMPSPMSSDHGDKNVPVVIWLDSYAEFTPGVLPSLGATMMLDTLGEPQPDLSLRIPHDLGGQSRIEDGFIAGAAEMVIEISRSSRRVDLGPKKADYERAGVLEYVVFEIDPNRVHWFILRDGRYVPQGPGTHGIYRSECFPGLWLDPAALFAKDRARMRAVLDLGLATPEHAAFVARLAERRVEP